MSRIDETRAFHVRYFVVVRVRRNGDAFVLARAVCFYCPRTRAAMDATTGPGNLQRRTTSSSVTLSADGEDEPRVTLAGKASLKLARVARGA